METDKRPLETGSGEKPHVTREDIKTGLRKLGLKRGHNVGVHSSLRSFGYVEGGADTVIDALLETVGPEGTVVMPTYSNNKEKLELTEEDKKLGITGKARRLPYDPEKTSCWTGKIPDIFWRRKEAVRGTNPQFSQAAIGKRAKELSQGIIVSSISWDRLLEADGYMLLLGVTLACCSAMHLAERIVFYPPNYVPNLPQSPEPPKTLKELMEKYDREGIRVSASYPGKLCYPCFAEMEEPCKKHGIMKMTKIGDATVRLLRLKELIELFVQYLRSEPETFYHT